MGSEFFKYIAKIYISSDGCVTQVWVTTEYYTWKSSCFSQCYGGVLSLNMLLQKNYFISFIPLEQQQHSVKTAPDNDHALSSCEL